ncbi:hypothetical protein [Paenibacillus sp. RC67]|uniref:hypothetical protein n=1 Tax=Paenibacillus sp. RC67 TaxID=3039392 RepID=UPI0024AD0448|nr:hypothetical protein [Paenibacillus sp. RC67]
MTSALVENTYIKLVLIFVTVLLVTTGFLFSYFGLKNARNNSQVFYILLGGLGGLIHTYLYAYFLIYSLAVLGSANTLFGLITYALIVIAPISIGYKTFGIERRTAKGK